MMIRSPTSNDEGFGSGPPEAFGGALITGGCGRYLGMLGGVLFLTALLQMLLAGTTLPYATKAILYGLVVLSAVMALRERRLQ